MGLICIKFTSYIDGSGLRTWNFTGDSTLSRIVTIKTDLHRGIGYLATPHMIKAISDLVGLVTRVDATGDAGLGTNGTD